LEKIGFSVKSVARMIENTGCAGVGGWWFVVREGCLIADCADFTVLS
jgi:hypothetical protein